MLKVGDLVSYKSGVTTREIYGVIKSIESSQVRAYWQYDKKTALNTVENGDPIDCYGVNIERVKSVRIDNWKEVFENAIQ